MSKIFVLDKSSLAIKKNGKLVAIESFEAPLSNCEPGMDSCNEYLLMWNYNSISGDKTLSALYIVDGVPVVNTVANAKAAIAAFGVNPVISATSVSMTGCLALTPLPALATRQLTATVLPSGASQAGTWTTSNAGAATVSSTGLVTAVATGAATITFTSTDGGFTKTCVITVPI